MLALLANSPCQARILYEALLKLCESKVVCAGSEAQLAGGKLGQAAAAWGGLQACREGFLGNTSNLGTWPLANQK